eukprot:PRCOL_00000770-RA
MATLAAGRAASAARPGAGVRRSQHVRRVAAAAGGAGEGVVHERTVYIEDTDCFGVVFYANYFRFAADARWEAGMDDGGVARIDSAKYTRAAKLGSALRMETFEEDGVVSHVARDAASGEELWSAQLVMRGDEDGDCAQLELAAAGKSDFVVRTHVRAYPDEVGPGGVASETDVLRWFERCRTETLGGAAGLAALQDSGVHVVVARITKGAFIPQLDVLGKELCVRSVVKVVRRGAMVKFTQQLLDPSDATTAAEGRVLASAEVTCASIGADDGAVCALPPTAADALAAAASQA